LCCELGFCCGNRGSSWDHRGVLLSLVYRLLRCLLGLLAVLARPDPWRVPAAEHNTGVAITERNRIC